MIPQVREYLSSDATNFWVLCDASARVMGFMGMSENRIESLFFAPEFFRCGGGRRLIRYAQSLHDELVLDVNEQNSAATEFYRACGFKVEGRSELDAQGRPYPLLHMRLTKIEKPNSSTEEGTAHSK